MDTKDMLLARLRYILGLDEPAGGLHKGAPRWRPFNHPDAPYFREQVLRTHLQGGPCDADQLVTELRATFSLLLSNGLLAASARARQWLEHGHLSFFTTEDCAYEVIFDVHARSATRVFIVSAVLYVDGIALAIFHLGATLKAATAHIERLEESIPAWFVTPALLVALADDGVAVSVPGLGGDRWSRTDDDVLAQILQPMAFVRYARFDVRDERRGGSLDRSFLPPGTVRAVELGLRRVLEGGDGLVSVPEGAAHHAAVRSLVARLREQTFTPIVLASGTEPLKRLNTLLADLDPCEAEPGLESKGVIVARPAQLADLHDKGFLATPGDRAIIAFDVDAGFRGEQGFSVRLHLPDVPWISFTTLPPEAIPAELKHAFANPLDEEGFLDIVSEVSGRVPIYEDRYVGRNVIGAAWVGRAADVVRQVLPHDLSVRALVLVSTPAEAADLTDSLQALPVRVHNATEWGSANEGWKLLHEQTDGAVVIRSSLPFWATVPDLDAAFVFRRIGRTTLARLRNLLGRPRPGKSKATLMMLASAHEAFDLGVQTSIFGDEPDGE